MSILEELYHGNINPSEKFIKKSGEYGSLLEELTARMDEFIPALNEKEKQLYEKIEDIITELGYISEKDCFVEGFRLGAQIVWEILHSENRNFYTV